jgi:inhibitor of cysteine peptidase
MNQRTIDRSYDNKTLDINVGDKLTIILEENPTTGYRWKLDQVNEEAMTLEDSKYSANSESQVGGGGYRTFIFRSVSNGATKISLSLRREWEKEQSPIDRFQISVQVG